MRNFKICALPLLVYVALQPLSFGQGVTAAEGPAGAAVISLEFISDSAVDSHGNLFVFRTVSQKSATLPNVATRVTVIPRTTPAIGPVEYSGIFSTIVAGEQAIYAISTATAADSTKESHAAQMNLVALTLTDKNSLPPSLPSLALDAPVQIQISPGHPDLLYLIHATTVLPKALGIPIAKTNLVRLIQFDGSKFTVVGEVSLP